MGQASVSTSPFFSFVWTLLFAALAVFAGVYVWDHTHQVLTSVELPNFLAVPLKYQAEAPIIRTLASVLAAFLTFFMVAYVFKAVLDALRLTLVSMSLKEFSRPGRFDDPDDHPSQRTWGYYPSFTRLWREYAETLHRQVVRDPKSGRESVVYRAFNPAELYLNTLSLVDIPLRVEFFRHLPGVLTGAGIVSTFAGILFGLTEFNPTVEPEQVTAQLRTLFTGVSTAFVASFFAIFAAILVTVVEKLILHWRYTQVSFLQGRIDDLFRAGVESEYLAQLVENGKTQGAQLQTLLAREAGAVGAAPAGEHLETLVARMAELQAGLVKELRSGLREEMATLVAAMERQSASEPLQALSRSLDQGLGDAMQSISRSLERGLGDAMHALSRSLENSLEQNLTQPLVRLAASQEQGREEQKQMVAPLRDLVTGMEILRQELGTPLRQINGTLQGLGEERRQLVEPLQAMLKLFESLREERQGLERALATLAALLENTVARGESVTGQLTQALDRGAAIDAGVNRMREELRQEISQQGERMASLEERATILLAEEIRHLLQELNQLQRDAGQERDAFLLASLSEGRGELTRELKEAFAAGVEKPAQVIADAMREVREEQERQGRQLSEAILEAFAAHLRLTVEKLVEKLSELGHRISQEREAMEQSIRGLLEGMADASRQGGEQLSGQIERAMAGSEVRQNHLLEALTKFTADLKVDVNLLQERMASASRQVSEQLAAETRELVARSAEETRQGVQEGIVTSADMIAGDVSTLKETLLALYKERGEEERQRGEMLTQRLDSRSGELMDQVMSLFRESLTREQAMESTLLQRLESGDETVVSQIREAVQREVAGATEALAQGLQESGSRQERQAQQLADMMLATIASKVETTFGGLADGLTDLRQRFTTERQSIRDALQTWVDDLAKSNRADAMTLAERVQQVLNEVENRHEGVMGALQQFGQTMSHEMAGMKDGIIHTTEESSRELAKHVDDVVTTIGQEHSAFIEMMSERVDTLRKRLNVK